MGPLCRGKAKFEIEDRDPYIKFLTCHHRQLTCLFELTTGVKSKKNIIGLQDWASNEAQNQRNICSAIMFVSRRNQHARLGHTHVWPLACAYSCIHMCNMYQYFWIPILLFTYIYIMVPLLMIKKSTAAWPGQATRGWRISSSSFRHCGATCGRRKAGGLRALGLGATNF